MHYLIAAILANFSYALLDVLAALVAKKNPPLRAAFWAAVTVVLTTVLPIILFFQHELARLTPVNIVVLLSIGSLVALGYLSFVTGLHKGSSILTPVIAGAFPVVTTFAALLFFGETVTLAQAVAIAIILIGVLLSSLEGSVRTLVRDIRSSALVYAFGACLLWGVYYAVIRISIDRVGWFTPILAANLIAIPLFLLIARWTGQKRIFARPKAPHLIIMAALVSSLAGVFFNYALSQGPTSVVAPIAGSSPAIFVVIAYFVFREKLNKYQQIGILTTVVGIVSLSVLQ